MAQVAPPDLETLYLCTVISFGEPGVSLYVVADLCMDEDVVIFGDGAVQHLGLGREHFVKKTNNNLGSYRHHGTSSDILNVLIPTRVRLSTCNACHQPIMDRLDPNEYLWFRHMGSHDFIIHGVIQSH